MSCVFAIPRFLLNPLTPFGSNSDQLYGNISYVDFVSMPVALTLEADGTATQHVSGGDQNQLSTVVNGLKQQDAIDRAGWSKLIYNDAAGNALRVLSPNNGKVQDATLFSNYFEPYVKSVFDAFQNKDLTIDTQADFGKVAGRVANGSLTFNPGNLTFSAPSTTDIFGCSTGPFVTGGATEKDAIIPRLAAAFNRSVLLTHSDIPATPQANAYYQDKTTNHYARVVHAANLDGKGYAFPYDDVQPTGGEDQSGKVQAGSPTKYVLRFDQKMSS